MGKILIALLFFCIIQSTNLFGQNYVDILKLNTSTTPNNLIDSSNSKTKINELFADLSMPIKLSNKNTFLSGFLYEKIQARLFPENPVSNFGSICLKIGLNRTFNEKLIGTFVLLPKLASDFKSSNSKDFQMGAIGFLKFIKTENLNYKVGIYCNTELFGPFFVPLIGLYYLSKNKKLETNLMLPLQADVNYSLIPFAKIGANFIGQTRTYHLNNITSTNRNSYLAKVTNEFYSYLRFNISSNLSLYSKVGISLGRSYRVYDSKDKVDFGLPATFIGPKRTQLNSDFSDGLIYQLSLLYRFNLNK